MECSPTTLGSIYCFPLLLTFSRQDDDEEFLVPQYFCSHCIL